MGTFVLTTGEDILTRFEITEGKIESAVEGLRKDFTEDRSYLDNASFGDGMNKWDTENEATFFLLGSKWIWANGAPLSDKRSYASVKTDGGRTTVYIRNKYILQKHANFRFIPDYTDVNNEGQKKPEAVYLSFFYRVAKAGRLTIRFEGLDKTGFENFNEFSYDGELGVTDGYQVFNHSGLWNGTGDFKLAFTGEIYLYMLVLSTDRAEALAYKYKTLFEQSEKLVKIAAANFDKDGNVIETSSIVTTSKYNELMSQYFDEDGQLKNKAGLVTTAMANTLYAFDADGNIVSMVEQTASDIKISAANISLEGLVTANENFKILEDGSIETNNGVFRGRIEASGGTFSGKDGLYELRMDADNRTISIKGPDLVVGENDFSAAEDAEAYEYITIGNFVYTGSTRYPSGKTEHYIAPQIVVRQPIMGYTPSSCRYVKIDPYNGVVIGTVLDGTDTAAALLAADGSMLNASLLLLKNLPTDGSLCDTGQVYRDGSTLKIKT
jgi:hypothetical protein